MHLIKLPNYEAAPWSVLNYFISAGNPAKRYKQYEYRSDKEVPRSTKSRWWAYSLCPDQSLMLQVFSSTIQRIVWKGWRQYILWIVWAMAVTLLSVFKLQVNISHEGSFLTNISHYTFQTSYICSTSLCDLTFHYGIFIDPAFDSRACCPSDSSCCLCETIDKLSQASIDKIEYLFNIPVSEYMPCCLSWTYLTTELCVIWHDCTIKMCKANTTDGLSD